MPLGVISGLKLIPVLRSCMNVTCKGESPTVAGVYPIVLQTLVSLVLEIGLRLKEQVARVLLNRGLRASAATATPGLIFGLVRPP